MLKGRYILATLAAALAAAAVWCWPVQPLWQSGPNAGTLKGFSPDGQLVVTFLWSGSGIPFVSRWDAATGKLLSRVEFPLAHPGNPRMFWPSPDGRRAVLGESPKMNPDPSDGNFWGGEWRLFDAVTGKQLAGPFVGLTMIDQGSAFSPDGRWFWGIRGDVRAESGIDGIDIYSADTGDHLFGLHGDSRAGDCLFAPDGMTAAVDLIPKKGKSEADTRTFRIIELPSGRERRRFQLPPGPWIRYDHWDGRYLDAVAIEPNGPHGKPLWFTCRFDTDQDPLGEGTQDPLLQWDEAIGGERGSWIHSPDRADCVGYFRIAARDELSKENAWLAWFNRQLGLERPPFNAIPMSVRFVDRATGQTRHELPRLVGHPPRLSPDGRRFACHTRSGNAIEVCDTHPPVRWHKALLAGLAAAAGVLAIAAAIATCRRLWGRRRMPGGEGSAAVASGVPTVGPVAS